MNKFFLLLSYVAMCGIGVEIGSLVARFETASLYAEYSPTTTVVLLLCNIIAFVAMLLLAVKV